MVTPTTTAATTATAATTIATAIAITPTHPTSPIIHRFGIACRQKVQFGIKGRSHHASGYLPYLQYLEHLRTRRAAPKEHESFEAPYLGEYVVVPSGVGCY